MGNTNTPASKLLDVKLSIPNLSASQASRLVAEVRAGSGTLYPKWGEDFRLTLSEDFNDVSISLFSILEGCKSQLGQVQLPVSVSHLESLGLWPDGPSHVINMDITDAWALVVELRMPGSASESEPQGANFQFQLPSARRQAIALELQNAELQKLVMARDGSSSAAPPMKHRLLVERVQAANAKLQEQKQTALHRLEHMRTAVASHAAARSFHAQPEQPEDLAEIQSGLQQELHMAMDRQRALREANEARIAAIEIQLQQVVEQQTLLALPEAEAQALLAIATGRREELRRMCRESEDINTILSAPQAPMRGLEMSPEIDSAQKQRASYQAELETLRQGLAGVSQSSNYQGWQQHEEMTQQVHFLTEELEQVSRGHQDDLVCNESEIVELRRERAKAKDRLADLISELRQLEARAEMLRTETLQAAVPKHESTWHRESCRQIEAELHQLRHMEEVRQQRIRALEQDQEKLVEQTTLATTGAVVSAGGEDAQQGAKAKAEELEQTLGQLWATIEKKKDDAAHMRQQTQHVRKRIETLQQTYSELQRSLDERVLRDPQPRQLATAS